MGAWPNPGAVRDMLAPEPSLANPHGKPEGSLLTRVDPASNDSWFLRQEEIDSEELVVRERGGAIPISVFRKVGWKGIHGKLFVPAVRSSQYAFHLHLYSLLMAGRQIAAKDN